MKLENKQLIEIVGIIAVVASLLFVGLELRQTREIAVAAQYQERSYAALDYYYEILGHDSGMSRIAERIESREWPPGFLSDQEANWLAENKAEERASRDTWAIINLFIFDNHYFQYQSGFLTEESWLSVRSRLQIFLENDVFSRYHITVRSERWRSSYVELCKDLIAENKAIGASNN